MQYNPALDGLRALAIIVVICDHAGVLPGGLIGVDVFFVLSGYLITSILLIDLREIGRISLPNFYWRRALRLTPALAILASFELTRSLFNPHGAEIREAVLAASLYLQDFDNIFNFTRLGLMGHTWSLATEEQFYLLWPLALPLIFMRRPLIWLGAAAAAMIVFPALPIGYSRPEIDFSPVLRPVGLLVGCALAIMSIQIFLPIIKRHLITGPILLASLLCVAVFEERVVVLAPLAASLITAGMIVCLQAPGPLTAPLSMVPMRYIGKISYGLFLYHVPILTLGHKWIHGPVGSAALIAFAFIAAALSYEFVEKPFLRLKGRRPNRSVTDLEESRVAAVVAPG
jgi:peptidoglycan/LPS O-acetylase OafA/YrhL